MRTPSHYAIIYYNFTGSSNRFWCWRKQRCEVRTAARKWGVVLCWPNFWWNYPQAVPRRPQKWIWIAGHCLWWRYVLASKKKLFLNYRLLLPPNCAMRYITSLCYDIYVLIETTMSLSSKMSSNIMLEKYCTILFNFVAATNISLDSWCVLKCFLVDSYEYLLFQVLPLSPHKLLSVWR